MERRNFLKNVSARTGALLAGPGLALTTESASNNANLLQSIERLKKPLAIAMWDFSWILRHHRYGEFENWDKVLEELAERGYNAIRIDAMPQYVASDTDGKIREEFRSVKTGWIPTLWGNYYTMSFRPREALLEFLPKCRKYGIRVGLSSWFVNHNTGLRDIFMEEGGVLRAWTETLNFLKNHHLLDDNIIYVDLLNEYPVYHGYDWFKKQMNARGNISQFRIDNPDAFVPNEEDGVQKGAYNALQSNFQQEFGNSLIRQIRVKFPDQVYHMSVTCTTPIDSIDMREFGTVDYHLWLSIIGDIPHWRVLGSMDQSKDNRPLFQELKTRWQERKSQTIRLADEAITAVSKKAREYNISCGNTEGWGPVCWFDHPELDWKWVKDAGDIAVDLARKHDNYKYICSSNFTHPQFKGMWEDVRWHRKITDRIKT